MGVTLPMKNKILLLAALLSTATFAVTGCASPNDSASADVSNLESSAEYDAVVAAPGHTVVENDATITPTQSFKARTKSYYAGKGVDEVGGKLVSFAEWTEIREEDGSQPFLAATVESDTTAGDVRTITGKFSLKDNVPLQMKAVITTDFEGDVTVHAENTAPVSVSLGGATIVVAETGKLVIDVKIGAYSGGTIVDGTMAAKAASPLVEGQAASRLKPVLPAIVKWSRGELGL